MDRLSTHRLGIHRIGLISPYSGGNSGNAAILSAMIANIRMRIGDAEIVGITLNPGLTRRRHGIEAFPLAAVSRPYYDLINSDGNANDSRGDLKPRKIKQWLKQVPLLRSIVRAIRTCGKELAHIAAAAGAVRKLDCVIIPGGGALDEFWGGPWGHPWTLFKWSVLSRVYGVPFLFVSVGKSPLERPLSRFFVRNALRLAKYRSYRDQETKVAVQSLINAHNDPVYPDLAFSYPCPIAQTSHSNGSQDGRLVVGVSPIAYCDPRSWPRKDARRYAAYVSQLAEIVKWLIQQRYRVLFFTTDTPDIATVEDVRARLSDSAIDAGAVQVMPSLREQDTDSLLQGLASADFVIASRLHGVILSHLNATPVLALSFDPKVDAYMNTVGQSDYCLHIEGLQFDSFTERFTALSAARERERAHLRAATLRFRNLLDLQYDQILGAPQPSTLVGDHRKQVDAFSQSEVGGLRASAHNASR